MAQNSFGFLATQDANGLTTINSSIGQPLKLSIFGEEKMRIHSNGNIGIATNNPLVSFVVEKDDAIKIPVGGVNARPANSFDGYIRYNNEYKLYEGYKDGQWVYFNGLMDTDRDTFITAENTLGVDEDLSLIHI